MDESIKTLTEAYQEIKKLVMKRFFEEGLYDITMVEDINPEDVKLIMLTLKYADTAMKVMAEQDYLLREMNKKMDTLLIRSE